ncbi:MAG: tryptophan--tRNA ligase [Planctomycetes bacterium]|nr:tryptophan--tRNA ligase [Planctomycetota bacterium]
MPATPGGPTAAPNTAPAAAPARAAAPALPTRPRILSGIQPSGRPHIGNYFGAIQQHIQLQDQGEAFYFIANFHALNTIKDAAQLRELTFDVAATYLALGLDPKKAVFFRQSDVPEVTELAWLLATVTGMGLLERAHAYKDKVAKGSPAGVGLFTYPVLMAADILIYKSQLVPVGQDQVQHIEMTQDMAEHFNHAYGPVLVRPEARLSPTPKVPGTDGQKMSKSYGNTIELFAEGAPLKKAVMGIVTDSTPVEAPKDPQRCTAFALYSLFANESERAELAERYRKGGLGYGEVKKELLARLEAQFAPFRQRRRELLSDRAQVEAVLRDGAERARAVARQTLAEARRACGLE